MRISDWSSDVCSSDLITDRHLPDKAIDVIDEAAARLRLLPESKRRKTVQVRDLEETVARIARIPPKSVRSEEHTSELQSLMRTSYAVCCLKKKIQKKQNPKAIIQQEYEATPQHPC